MSRPFSNGRLASSNRRRFESLLLLFRGLLLFDLLGLVIGRRGRLFLVGLLHVGRLLILVAAAGEADSAEEQAETDDQGQNLLHGCHPFERNGLESTSRTAVFADSVVV